MTNNKYGSSALQIVLVVFSVVFGVIPCLAGVAPGAQQLLVTASRQSDIFVADASPFRLEADFKAQVQVPTEGHISLKWDSNNRFWRRISDAGFEQVDIKNGEMFYVRRNAPFTPLRISEAIGLLSISSDPDKLQIKKARNRMEHGVSVTCFDVRHDGGRGKKNHDICVDPSSHDVLSEEWNEPPDEHRREEFSHYADFRGHRYPRKIALIVNGSRVIELRVASLDAAPALADANLIPAPGAIARRQCAGLKHPVPLKTPDPLYPKSSSENRLIGDTSVSMTVLADGSVADIQLVGSSTRAMDDATLQTLKSWKFKPAMCGSEPVASDITVVVSFRLQ